MAIQRHHKTRAMVATLQRLMSNVTDDHALPPLYGPDVRTLADRTYFPQVAKRICAQFPHRWGSSGLARCLQLNQSFGLLLPRTQEAFGVPVIVDGVL